MHTNTVHEDEKCQTVQPLKQFMKYSLTKFKGTQFAKCKKVALISKCFAKSF